MTDRLTDQQLDEIAARADALNGLGLPGGSWATSPRDEKSVVPPEMAHVVEDVLRTKHSLLRSSVGVFGDERHAEFVAHAREDVPALLAEIRRLKQQRRYLIGQLAKKDAASGAGDKALREFLGAEPTTEPDIAAADNPTPLRWGLNDVLWGDDDTVAVLLSGPTGEPYWLELDPERAAVLREDLAGPGGNERHETETDVPVHACPSDGSGLTSCCERTPFELRTDRMTEDPAEVTCPGWPPAAAAGSVPAAG
ncbi:hypothetical protein [Streptomyces shenzhenensis]|uniref:hypothetical protein n=1 Tax=Streptomyces shenzhenensis TaxID=943815 RepID=UPI00368082ED